MDTSPRTSTLDNFGREVYHKIKGTSTAGTPTEKGSIIMNSDMTDSCLIADNLIIYLICILTNKKSNRNLATPNCPTVRPSTLHLQLLKEYTNRIRCPWIIFPGSETQNIAQNSPILCPKSRKHREIDKISLGPGGGHTGQLLCSCKVFEVVGRICNDVLEYSFGPFDTAIG